MVEMTSVLAQLDLHVAHRASIILVEHGECGSNGIHPNTKFILLTEGIVG